MSYPAPWHTIGRHALLPTATHDEVVRFDVVAQLNAHVAQRLAPKVREAYEAQAVNAWRMRHGREPADRHEVAEAMQREPAYRSFSLVRRHTMEIRQQAGRSLVARQRDRLRDVAREVNAEAATLRLDPALDLPRYVTAVDTHLMQGGYTAERVADDVGNAANYDAGMYATIGGSGGPWNDAAGRALVAWVRREHPRFAPRRIVDLGCGLGHNTLPLRDAFPEAEIIAVDVAAPMLRYGHARAQSRGYRDVQFVQADATATGLEESSADLVFTTMVLHETSRQALPKIFAEAHRLLRAGGLTIHLEQPPYRGIPAFEQFMRDWDGRYNNEPFWSALHESDLAALLAKAGFGAANVFETRCVAPPAADAGTRTEAVKHEDFGRAPAWYAVGAWQAAKGIAAIG
ncbi:MAG: methyltransferase domain-containing protein [Gammaproteobacteria bacterium]|nr:methyltransferase domain-containing protein [Gammaproteobacteria bacterium]